ncbi:MAG: malectin domain-containing carbohydrate-binding protein [Terracidiphilus sp.]
MPLDHPNVQPADAERTEIEAVVEALARWPRLSQLLRYMGESFFSGKVDNLNEYNIATEVLGRSKTVFNAADDAIARVETHRLRKRLTEFYEKEGRDHQIQVTLPPGSYVPVFIHKPEGGLPSPVSANISSASQSDLYQKNWRPVWLTQYWKYAISAACLAFVALGIFLYLHTRASSTRLTLNGGSAPASDSAALQPKGSSPEIRLLAGYSGPPRTDSAGRAWNPDQYFSGGGSWQRAPGFIARTSDPFLFEHSRTGDFSYSIPLKSGFYELHLFFSTPVKSSESTSFNVGINGEYPLLGFDINADALGEDIADERVFRDVSPGKDGFLRLQFVGATGVPSLNAIEILPGIPHAQLPIRLIMQTTPITDHDGRLWHADNYYMHGRLSAQTHPLPHSPDPDLFSGERYGHFTYAIPVDTRDRYTIILHFAEFYFGSGSQGNGGAGSRIFKVMCNGQTLLDDFDIFKEAGSLNELTETFRHLKPSALGKLNLTFEPIANNATVSGIEVLDESK